MKLSRMRLFFVLFCTLTLVSGCGGSASSGSVASVQPTPTKAPELIPANLIVETGTYVSAYGWGVTWKTQEVTAQCSVTNNECVPYASPNSLNLVNGDGISIIVAKVETEKYTPTKDGRVSCGDVINSLYNNEIVKNPKTLAYESGAFGQDYVIYDITPSYDQYGEGPSAAYTQCLDLGNVLVTIHQDGLGDSVDAALSMRYVFDRYITVYSTVTSYNSVTDQPNSTPSQVAKFTSGERVSVSVDDINGLNVRTSPGGDSSTIIGYPLSDGTHLTIVAGPKEADGETWYQVRLAAGTTGWVLGKYLSAA